MPIAAQQTTSPAPSPVDLKRSDQHGKPALRPWIAPEVTQQDLPWASLEQVDLSLLDSTDPAIRTRLVSLAKKALIEDGFLFVTGTGVSDATLERQLAIAQLALEDIPDEEKRLYAARLDEGSYRGYKPLGIWERDGVKDNIEHYNLESPSFDKTVNQHPPALQPYLDEIEDFAKYTYQYIVRRILTLISLVLELEPDALWNLHGHEDPIGAACQRYMRYVPRNEEDDIKTERIWSKGHTDYNTVSLLFSQPISALQILTNDNEWRWVKHVPGSVVVNVADALQFLSGNILKATRHRVIQPPSDQSDITRFILIHFARARLDVVLNPIAESPLVQREGVHAFQDRLDAGEGVPTQGSWLEERIRRTGRELYDDKGVKPGAGKVEEFVLGRKVTYYV